ncbi:MAG: hypothetical protein ACYCYO_00085 [Bacilli bacterium]
MKSLVSRVTHWKSIAKGILQAKKIYKNAHGKQEYTRAADQNVMDVTTLPNGEKGFSARGIITFSYLSMVGDHIPKAATFMDKFYQITTAGRKSDAWATCR